MTRLLMRSQQSPSTSVGSACLWAFVRSADISLKEKRLPDSKPETCLGGLASPISSERRIATESNKAFVLPPSSATAREEILGLSPFSAEPGALDGCESRDPHASRKLHK